ncbi:MAG: hypothetical protein AAF608_14675 [Pseudomonadota bacterium]
MAQHYLGFDLGHADTALALCGGGEGQLQAAPTGVEIQGQSIQPTALTRVVRDGEAAVVIGGRAIREASKAEGSGGPQLRAAFKTRPRDLGAARDDLRDFFSACLSEAAFTPLPPLGWAGTSITVGCPSGWSAEEDIHQYQAILAEGLAGTAMEDAEVNVVPESRAALLQAVDNPHSLLTMAARSENILVIDIGSSTLDFSLIAPEQGASPLLDAGLDLGASFFDRRVLEAVLAGAPKAVRFLEHNPHYRDLWLYYARRTKEQYFIDAPEDDEEIVTGAPLQPFYTGGRRSSLEISVTGADVAAFRQAPYDRELNPSSSLVLDPEELRGMSWEAIFEASLVALKAAIERRGASYGRVLLAGGASRMPFTEEITRRVFEPDGETSLVLKDPEPSHMVSRGLARWGRKRDSVEQFSRAARDLLRERLPGLIDAEFAPLKERLSAGLADEIFDGLVAPVLDQWKDGAFKTGQDVREEIEQRYQSWLSTGPGAAFFVRTINGWWRDEVKHDVDRELDRLHAAYGISRDIQLSFDDAIDPQAFQFSATSVDLPFETIVQAALLSLAFAVTVAIDAVMGGIPFFTGGLAAATAVGGKPLQQWIARIDAPAFARRLPDRLPGRERLFGGRAKARVRRQLAKSLVSAKTSLLTQVQAAITASIDRQTLKTRALLMGEKADEGRRDLALRP